MPALTTHKEMSVFQREQNSEKDGTDEERLITLLQKGNQSAFEKIYGKYSGGLYNLALMYLKSPVLAEDALQYVFLRLWEVRQSVDANQNIRNFLFTILKNHILNTLKSKQNEVERHMEVTKEVVADMGDGVQEKMLFEQRLSAVYGLIEGLPQQKKRVCELKMAGLSNLAVSEQMGISINTVKVQYSSALNMLREKLLK